MSSEISPNTWRRHSSRRSRSLTSLVGGVHFLNNRDRLQDNSEHITFTATASMASCACYSKCDDNKNTKSGIDTWCTKHKIWTYAALGQLHNAQYDASGFPLGTHLAHPLPLHCCEGEESIEIEMQPFRTVLPENASPLRRLHSVTQCAI